jgi:hypothetical protein
LIIFASTSYVQYSPIYLWRLDGSTRTKTCQWELRCNIGYCAQYILPDTVHCIGQ